MCPLKIAQLDVDKNGMGCQKRTRGSHENCILGQNKPKMAILNLKTGDMEYQE